MTPAAIMTQMNTRIEQDLKQRGDAVLAEAGFSPSDAVRALWKFAVAHEREPKAVTRAHALDDPKAEARREAALKKIKVLDRAETDMTKTLEFLGVTEKTAREVFELSDIELLEQALTERYAARGLL